jgi:hypothetical protein
MTAYAKLALGRLDTARRAELSYALYVLAGLCVLSAVARVGMIGKPRKRITRSDAVISVVFLAVQATILVIAAIRLG